MSTKRSDKKKPVSSGDQEFNPELLDELLGDSTTAQELLGQHGLIKQLTKALLERALQGELTHELGYEKHHATGRNSGNSRNGSGKKTLKGEFGELDLYTFSATAGQQVDFSTANLDAEVDRVNWSLSAPDGSVIFDEPLFTDPGTFTLADPGTCTLLVGSDADEGTGAYEFSLVNVP